MNAPTNSNSGTNLVQQAKNEEQFFQEEGMQDLIDGKQAGCNSLVDKISDVYEAHLRKEWVPTTQKLLSEKMSKLRLANENLGQPTIVVGKDRPNPKYFGEQMNSVISHALHRHIDTVSKNVLIPLEKDLLNLLGNQQHQQRQNGFGMNGANTQYQNHFEFDEFDASTFQFKPLLLVKINRIVHTASSKAVKSVTNVIIKALRADVGISGATKLRIGRFTTFINNVVNVLRSTENPAIVELQSRLSAKMAICIETKIEPVLNFEESNEIPVTSTRRMYSTGRSNGSNSEKMTSPKVRFKCVDPKSIADAANFMIVEAIMTMQQLDAMQLIASENFIRSTKDWKESCSQERLEIQSEMNDVAKLQRKLASIFGTGSISSLLGSVATRSMFGGR